MNEIIAPCGIVCNDCQAYIATQANDLNKLDEIAESWSDETTQYNRADIFCNGCFSQRLHKFCENCEVRLCAKENGYKVCSECSLYPCDRLRTLWSSFSSYSAEDLKLTLDRVAGKT